MSARFAEGLIAKMLREPAATFKIRSDWKLKAFMSICAYRVLNFEEFSNFQVSGVFEGAAKDREAGFIHLSTLAQLPARLRKFEALGCQPYVLAIDLEKVQDILGSGPIDWLRAM